MNQKLNIISKRNKKLDNNDIEKGDLSILNTSVSSNYTSNFLSDEISEMQPSAHEDKKQILEIYCCRFLFNDYDLTKREYKCFNELKKECLIAYDQNNNTHEKLLKDVYDTFLETFDDREITNKSWKDLGFQVYIVSI